MSYERFLALNIKVVGEERIEPLYALIEKCNPWTVNKQFGSLRERLAQGTTIRLLIIDPNSLRLEMSAWRSEVPEDNPTFELRAARDGEWYTCFRRQFDLMWASCRLEKLSESR